MCNIFEKSYIIHRFLVQEVFSPRVQVIDMFARRVEMGQIFDIQIYFHDFNKLTSGSKLTSGLVALNESEFPVYLNHSDCVNTL